VKVQLTAAPFRADRARLGDRVAAELERRILHGELEAGAQLPTESELCDIFGVSRTVIRDAVRTVAARGLLEVRAGRGTTVRPPSDEAFSRALLALLMRSGLTMGEVMDAREALETALAELAATRSTREQRRELAAGLERFAAAVAREDWPETHRANLDLHLGLLRATNLPALELMLKPLQQVILACAMPVPYDSFTEWDRQVRDHEALHEALEARDPAAARKTMRKHFRWHRTEPYAQLRLRPFGGVPSVREVLG
jgi:GntR family transcriptional regulator, transcriptional repressor for pyruvate dehydrogenase complex